MVKKNFLKSSLVIAIAVVMMLPIIPTISLAATSDKPSITYSAHMQTYGWDKTNQKPGEALNNEAKNFAGVTGQSKRMEALEINVTGAKLEYRAHVQGEGWMDWVAADDSANHKATVGTTGRSLRVEALQLSVKGLEGYSILYRAHVQGEGWMDWVDAADPTAYAGTEGRSLRMEAFEIVVVPDNEFYYVNNHNGTHTRSYNGKLGATEDCVYGEYAVNGSSFTKQCALCGYSNGETKSLQGVLTDAKLDGQSKVSLESVRLSDDLTIPEGMTLEIDDNINTNNKNLVVNGHLVTKSTSGDSKITCGENGVITYRGVYDESGVLSSTLKENNTLLKHIDKIVLEKGSKDQTLGNTPAVVTEDSELVLDLNGTKVTSSATGDAITNNGKLTINDGIFSFTGNTTGGIRSQGENSELVVNHCTINSDNTARAISVGEESGATDKNVTATISDTKINVKGEKNWAVAAFGKDVTVDMKNVEITSKAGGIYTNAAKDANKSVFNCENITVNSDSTAIYFGSEGTYTLNNSTVKGHEGIEYTIGTLTLNNTNVTATGEQTEGTKVTETSGEGTYTATSGITGHSNGFGSAVQVKQLTQNSEKSAELNVNGSSKLTAEHSPAILVFSEGDTYDDSKVKLHYPNDSVSGYTKENVKGTPVVWAHVAE